MYVPLLNSSQAHQLDSLSLPDLTSWRLRLAGILGGLCEAVLKSVSRMTAEEMRKENDERDS